MCVCVCVHVYIYIHIHMYMYKDIFSNRYIYLFIHIFIIRSWLTSLQRLMIFKICSWQAGDPRELMVSFQFEGQKASDLGKGVLLEFKGRKKTNVLTRRPSCRRNSPLFEGGSAFLFYSGLQLIGWGPLTLGRAICFIQSIHEPIQNAPHRNN